MSLLTSIYSLLFSSLVLVSFVCELETYLLALLTRVGVWGEGEFFWEVVGVGGGGGDI